MATPARAKSKTTEPIPVTEKQALDYVKSALENFHPRTGPMKVIAADVKIKKQGTGMLLIWGDEKFTLDLAVG